MAKDSQKDNLIITHKKGVPVYESNPSIPDAEDIKKRKQVRVGNDKRGFMVDGGNGELLSIGGVGFYDFEEVDSTRFIKLFIDGVKQTTGLSKAGSTVFELVYHKILDKPNTDKIEMSFYVAAKNIDGLTERTYQRGLRELLDREILFKSPADGVFFINVRYMFNGDRLAFIKGYTKKKTIKDTSGSALDHDDEK